MCGWGPYAREASVWEACCRYCDVIHMFLNCPPCSSRKLARSVGASWRLRCKGNHHPPGASDLCSKHSPPECQRQRRAPRTLSLPPPHTVQQPQACSISRSLMAASLQRQPPSSRCFRSVQQALSTRVPEAETSTTHLESASASHRAAAASLLDQSEPHGGSVAKQRQPPSWKQLVDFVFTTRTELARSA